MRLKNNVIYCLSLLMCLSAFVAEADCKKINASQACIKELRAGDVDIFGTLTVATGTASFGGIVDITNTTQSTTCSNGALVVAGGVGIGKNLNVCGQVSNKIGATYTIGVDFPTIQAGIDLVNSGLKPDSASNANPLPAGAKNVTLQIPAGTYNETLLLIPVYPIQILMIQLLTLVVCKVVA